MSDFSDGRFRITRGGAWLGNQLLLSSGDTLAFARLRKDGTGHSVVDLAIISGDLAGASGTLKLADGSARAIGRISGNGSLYGVAAEMIGVTKSRSVRLVLIRQTVQNLETNEEEGGGEWEGDEEP